MKKVKFLILALLGITIIPSAYAVPLDFSIYGYTTEFDDRLKNATICNVGYLPFYNFYECSFGGGPGTHQSQFAKSIYYRFFFTFKGAPTQHIIIPGVHVRDIGETREIRWSYFDDQGKQGHNSLILPNRTAYQQTVNGQKNTFTELFFFPYQFTLYDPKTRNSLTYIGKNKLVNGMLLANPGVQTDNVRLISLNSKKAWSITMDEQSARDVLLGRGITENYLKTLQFTKSYTVRDGGKQIVPEKWRPADYFEGTGFIYTPDSEFVAPKWSTPADENTPIQQYNQCVAYYNSIKTYAAYDRQCYNDLLDSAPLTGSYDANALLASRQAIDEWNGEGEGPVVSGRICNLWKGYKKSYKNKFKDKWSEFLEISKANRLSPYSLDVKSYCGEKPRDEQHSFFASEKITERLRNYWNKISGKEKIGKVNDKEVPKAEYDASLINIWTLKSRCENPGAYMSFVPIWDHNNRLEEFRKKFCDEYNLELEKHNQKYSKLKYFSGYLEYYEGSGQKVDDFGLSRIISYFSSDYNSGFNFFGGGIRSCKNSVLVKEWDFLVYIPFFIFVFLAVKYIFK